MKTLLILALCLPAALAQQVEYKVSKGAADKAKLEAVFEAVRAQEEPPPVRTEKWEVFGKISSTQYVVFKKMHVLSNEPDVPCLLHLTEPMDKADREIISGIIVEDTGKTKTVNGTTYRVLAQQEPPARVDFTKEKFVEMLKAGETWTLNGFEGGSCHRCMGDGKLSAAEKEARCPDCKGNGTTKVDLLVKW